MSRKVCMKSFLQVSLDADRIFCLFEFSLDFYEPMSFPDAALDCGLLLPLLLAQYCHKPEKTRPRFEIEVFSKDSLQVSKYTQLNSEQGLIFHGPVP